MSSGLTAIPPRAAASLAEWRTRASCSLKYVPPIVASIDGAASRVNLLTAAVNWFLGHRTDAIDPESSRYRDHRRVAEANITHGPWWLDDTTTRCGGCLHQLENNGAPRREPCMPKYVLLKIK